MKKSELIEQLNKIEGDPYILMELGREDWGYASVWHVDQCYSSYSDSSSPRTYVWEEYHKDEDYEDAGFETEEEWRQFKANPENRVIVLRP